MVSSIDDKSRNPKHFEQWHRVWPFLLVSYGALVLQYVMAPGFIGPTVRTLISYNTDQEIAHWAIVFSLAAIFILSVGGCFVLSRIASSELRFYISWLFGAPIVTVLVWVPKIAIWLA